MSPSILKAPAKAMEIVGSGGKTPTPAFTKLYGEMRQRIADVFPDDDKCAWSWKSEEGLVHPITPPTWNANEWVRKRYLPSDRFSQRLAQRKITIRRDNPPGTKINGKVPFEHQEALDDWDTIQGICSGITDEACKALMRSPYATGKTLLSGRRMEGFRDLLLELMFKDKLKPSQLPTATILSLRKEIAIQNTLGGEQYTALRPPYTCEPANMREFHKSMVAAFGEKFETFFPKPKGRGDPWYSLFAVDDEGTEIDGPRRISDYLQAQGRPKVQAFSKWKNGDQAFSMLTRLIQGEIILLPDVQNKPKVYDAPVRSESIGKEFTGDNAYALHPDLGIKATHRHLLPDPSLYSTKTNMKDPAHILIAHGTAITRACDRVREDIAKEIMPRHSQIIIDEGGKLDPYDVADTTQRLSGRAPNILASTANDEGIHGWTERSPKLTKGRSVQLNLTRSIGFQMLGTGKKIYPAGSEGAWKTYREEMFQPVQAATKLKIPQPYELDALVVVPTKELRELAFRIEKAHLEEGISVDVHCFDSQAGSDRWKVIEHGLKAPKQKGDPRRVIVAPPALLTTGVCLPIQCIDLLANLQPHELDQLLGRLFHARNLGGSNKLRTYFRQMIHTGRCVVKLREIAEQMGFELPEEGAVWVPGQCAIDLGAKERDDKRRGMGDAAPVADAKRKLQKEDTKAWQSVMAGNNAKSPFVRTLLFDAAERKRKKLLGAGILPEPEQQKPKGKMVRAKQGNLIVEFSIGFGGPPHNGVFEKLAQEHGVWSYVGTIKRDVCAAFTRGVRGNALARVALDTIKRLQERAERMRGGNGNGS